jgi:hypothetical protein
VIAIGASVVGRDERTRRLSVLNHREGDGSTTKRAQQRSQNMTRIRDLPEEEIHAHVELLESKLESEAFEQRVGKVEIRLVRLSFEE